MTQPQSMTRKSVVSYDVFTECATSFNAATKSAQRSAASACLAQGWSKSIPSDVPRTLSCKAGPRERRIHRFALPPCVASSNRHLPYRLCNFPPLMTSSGLSRVLESALTNILTGRNVRAARNVSRRLPIELLRPMLIIHLDESICPCPTLSKYGEAYLWHLVPIFPLRAQASCHQAKTHHHRTHDRRIRLPVRRSRVPSTSGRPDVLGVARSQPSVRQGPALTPSRAISTAKSGLRRTGSSLHHSGGFVSTSCLRLRD